MKSNVMFVWLFFYMSLFSSDDSFDVKTIPVEYNRIKTVRCYQHNPYMLRYTRKNNRPTTTYTKVWKKIVQQD